MKIKGDADIRYQTAKELAAAGDYHQAIVTYREILKDPKDEHYDRALFDLAVLYNSLNDYESAFELWKRAAKRGDADAQYNLAMYYHYGLGVSENDKMARQWLQKAADAGHEKSKECLALL